MPRTNVKPRHSVKGPHSGTYGLHKGRRNVGRHVSKKSLKTQQRRQLDKLQFEQNQKQLHQREVRLAQRIQQRLQQVVDERTQTTHVTASTAPSIDLQEGNTVSPPPSLRDSQLSMSGFMMVYESDEASSSDEESSEEYIFNKDQSPSSEETKTTQSTQTHTSGISQANLPDAPTAGVSEDGTEDVPETPQETKPSSEKQETEKQEQPEKKPWFGGKLNPLNWF